MFFLKMIILVLLAIILVQDWRDREVSLWVLISTLVLSIGVSTYENVHLLTKNLWVNGLLITIQVLLLYLFLAVKNKTLKFSLFKYLGGADVIMFVILIPLIPFYQFLRFYVTCLVFSLVTFLLFKSFKNKHNTVPLAGLMSVCLIAFLSNHWFLNLI